MFYTEFGSSQKCGNTLKLKEFAEKGILSKNNFVFWRELCWLHLINWGLIIKWTRVLLNFAIIPIP
jgi:hypothetical protein